MKKIVSVLLVCLLCAWTLSGCLMKHPIQKFAETMYTADSYQVEIGVTDIPFVGELSVTLQVDGDVTYTPEILFAPAKYVEKKDGKQYVYTENSDGTWTKTEGEVEDAMSELDVEELLELLNPANYEEVEEGVFEQKDDVTFDDFEDVVITIGEDEYTIEAATSAEGLTVHVEIEISKINEVELTLPDAD